VEIGSDGCGGEGGDACYVLHGEVFEVEHGEADAFAGRQQGKHGEEAFGGYGGLGRTVVVQKVGLPAACGFVERDGCFGSRLQMVEPEVVGNAAEPSAELRGLAEGAQPLPHAHEGVLGEVVAEGFVAQRLGQEEAAYLGAMTFHECGETPFVACDQKPRYEREVVQHRIVFNIIFLLCCMWLSGLFLFVCFLFFLFQLVGHVVCHSDEEEENAGDEEEYGHVANRFSAH
jgi:hypothetical protein